MISRVREIAQLDSLVQLIQAATIKKIMNEYAFNPEQYFWHYLMGVLTDKASIEFCKIFDSVNDDIHWTKSFNKDDSDNIRTKFLADVDLSINDWIDYRKSILNFRNQLVAHHDLDASVKNFPDFTKILVIAKFMYKEILNDAKRNKLTIPAQFPDEIDAWTLDLSSKMSDIVKNAFAGSIHLGRSEPLG